MVGFVVKISLLVVFICCRISIAYSQLSIHINEDIGHEYDITDFAKNAEVCVKFYGYDNLLHSEKMTFGGIQYNSCSKVINTLDVPDKAVLYIKYKGEVDEVSKSSIGENQTYIFEKSPKFGVKFNFSFSPVSCSVSAPGKHDEYMCNEEDINISVPDHSELALVYLTNSKTNRDTLLKWLPSGTNSAVLKCSDITKFVGKKERFEFKVVVGGNSWRVDNPEYLQYNDPVSIDVNQVKYDENGLYLPAFDSSKGESVDLYSTLWGFHLNYQQSEDGYINTQELAKLSAGHYALTFFDKVNSCPITKEFIIPEVVCHYVKDDYAFWHGKDEPRNAVDLLFKYPSDDSGDEYENLKFYGFNPSKNSYSKVAVDTSLVEIPLEDKPYKTEKKVCKTTMYQFSCSPDTKTIAVVNAGIPVVLSTDFKHYPPITSGKASVADPHCSYSDAYLQIGDYVEGGLDSAYVYQIDDGPLADLPNDRKILLPDTLTDFAMTVFDKTNGVDTVGRMARSLYLGKFHIARPDTIKFFDTLSTDLLCNGDFSGKYVIGSVQLSHPDSAAAYIWYKNPNFLPEKLPCAGTKNESLAAGGYSVVLLNAGCSDTAYFSLSEPAPLVTSVDTVKNALCYGYSDGYITTTTQGGTLPYSYLWSNGATADSIGSLPEGSYKLAVEDSHGCRDSLTQEIAQPSELVNTISPGYTVCKGSELHIDEAANSSFESYYWTLPNGIIYHGSELTVASGMPEGSYVLTSIHGPCYTLDTTQISFSESSLPARFLMPSEAYVLDTLVLAEDSEIGGDFSWTYKYSDEIFTDVTEYVPGASSNQTYLLVERYGIGFDTITMYADNGVCKASLSKEVALINSERPRDESGSPMMLSGIFSRLQIGPNPSDGNFTLYANLTEKSELSVRLVDISKARSMALDISKYNSVSDHHEILFQDLGLAQGAYALIVSAAGQSKYIKFMVE